ncbi:hypothetical protein Agub_g8676 [Astrephomene gubernaculifera]|uniref:Guanylate cyclase domain-containing protein n=1 Tax=Astrephomene gubernaculifera TaxID=47775 RepID=A0AAD3DS77_9CHLO|nr:hypothetical protein Agub_g8676 [Astrephomene gubernaculifera]
MQLRKMKQLNWSFLWMVVAALSAAHLGRATNPWNQPFVSSGLPNDTYCMESELIGNTWCDSAVGANASAVAVGAAPNWAGMDPWVRVIRAHALCERGVVLNGPNAQMAASGRFLENNSLHVFSKLLGSYSNATGLAFNLSAITALQYNSIRNRIAEALPTNGDPGPLDFWMVSSDVLGMTDAREALLDLQALLKEDSNFQMADIPVAWRSAMTPYNADSYVVPVALLPNHLFYRADIFSNYDIAVPNTWDDVISLAAKYHGQDMDGDGQSEIGVCVDATSTCGMYGSVVRLILASMLQLRGPSHGIAFDPDDMSLLLVEGGVLAEALRIFQELLKYGFPDSTPCYEFYFTYFAQGRCLITIGLPLAFKVGSHYSIGSPMLGNLRTASLPGSARVLDRATGRLTSCTRELCPYGQSVAIPNSGDSVIVNKVVSFDSVGFVINKYSPFYRQAAAYRMLTAVFGPSGSKEFVLGFTEGGPTRYSHLNAQDWIDVGYEQSNTRIYLAEYQRLLVDTQKFIEWRFLYNLQIQDLLSQLVRSVVWNGVPISAAQGTFSAGVSGLVEEAGGPAAFQSAYRASLGLSDILSPWVESAVQSSGRSMGNNLLVASVLPTASIIVLFIVYIALRTHSRAMSKVLQRHRSAPGPGEVVLCVTDIQESTTLWETLPADVCQAAMQLHHHTIRAFALQYRGYESATEGDSFILAFHTAADCTRFALRTQEALLNLDWPPELLENHLASSQCVRLDASALPTWARDACGPTIRALLRTTKRTTTPSQQQLLHPPQTQSQRSRPVSTEGYRQHSAATAAAAGIPGASDGAACAAAVRMLSPLNVDAAAAAASVLIGKPAGSTCGSTAAAATTGTAEEGIDMHRQVPSAPQVAVAAATAGSHCGTGRMLPTHDALACHSVSSNDTSWLWTDSDRTGHTGQPQGAGAQCISSQLDDPAVRVEHLVFGRLLGLVFPTGSSLTQGSAPGTRASATSAEVPMFRGLRVRIGFHRGLLSSSEVLFNRASQRTVYSGPVLQLAKAVSDAGRGGHIMLSTSALAALDFVLLHREAGVVLHAGRHVLNSNGDSELELYSLFSQSLIARVAYLDAPRSLLEKAPGVLSAPLGCLAVAVVQVDEVASWGLEAAAAFHSATRAHAQQLVNQFRGYLLLTGAGALQAVFPDAGDAVRWLLTLQEDLRDGNTGVSATRGTMSGILNDQEGQDLCSPFKTQPHIAPALRGGVDVGPLQAGITVDGRMAYEGPACKRASCLAAHAPWQAVLVSMAVAKAVLGEGSAHFAALKIAASQLAPSLSSVAMERIIQSAKATAVASQLASAKDAPSSLSRHRRHLGLAALLKPATERSMEASTRQASGSRLSSPSASRSPSLRGDVSSSATDAPEGMLVRKTPPDTSFRRGMHGLLLPQQPDAASLLLGSRSRSMTAAIPRAHGSLRSFDPSAYAGAVGRRKASYHGSAATSAGHAAISLVHDRDVSASSKKRLKAALRVRSRVVSGKELFGARSEFDTALAQQEHRELAPNSMGLPRLLLGTAASTAAAAGGASPRIRMVLNGLRMSAMGASNEECESPAAAGDVREASSCRLVGLAASGARPLTDGALNRTRGRLAAPAAAAAVAEAAAAAVPVGGGGAMASATQAMPTHAGAAAVQHAAHSRRSGISAVASGAVAVSVSDAIDCMVVGNCSLDLHSNSIDLHSNEHTSMAGARGSTGSAMDEGNTRVPGTATSCRARSYGHSLCALGRPASCENTRPADTSINLPIPRAASRFHSSLPLISGAGTMTGTGGSQAGLGFGQLGMPLMPAPRRTAVDLQQQQPCSPQPESCSSGGAAGSCGGAADGITDAMSTLCPASGDGGLSSTLLLAGISRLGRMSAMPQLGSEGQHQQQQVALGGPKAPAAGGRDCSGRNRRTSSSFGLAAACGSMADVQLTPTVQRQALPRLINTPRESSEGLGPVSVQPLDAVDAVHLSMPPCSFLRPPPAAASVAGLEAAGPNDRTTAVFASTSSVLAAANTAPVAMHKVSDYPEPSLRGCYQGRSGGVGPQSSTRLAKAVRRGSFLEATSHAAAEVTEEPCKPCVGDEASQFTKTSAVVAARRSSEAAAPYSRRFPTSCRKDLQEQAEPDGEDMEEVQDWTSLVFSHARLLRFKGTRIVAWHVRFGSRQRGV